MTSEDDIENAYRYAKTRKKEMENMDRLPYDWEMKRNDFMKILRLVNSASEAQRFREQYGRYWGTTDTEFYQHSPMTYQQLRQDPATPAQVGINPADLPGVGIPGQGLIMQNTEQQRSFWGTVGEAGTGLARGTRGWREEQGRIDREAGYSNISGGLTRP